MNGTEEWGRANRRTRTTRRYNDTTSCGSFGCFLFGRVGSLRSEREVFTPPGWLVQFNYTTVCCCDSSCPESRSPAKHSIKSSSRRLDDGGEKILRNSTKFWSRILFSLIDVKWKLSPKDIVGSISSPMLLKKRRLHRYVMTTIIIISHDDDDEKKINFRFYTRKIFSCSFSFFFNLVATGERAEKTRKKQPEVIQERCWAAVRFVCELFTCLSATQPVPMNNVWNRHGRSSVVKMIVNLSGWIVLCYMKKIQNCCEEVQIRHVVKIQQT